MYEVTVQPLAINQILQHLVKTKQSYTHSSGFRAPLNKGGLRVGDKQIPSIICTLCEYSKIDRDVNHEHLLRRKNPHFFEVTLPALMKRFQRFTFDFLFHDDYQIILDEHSYINGVWHFSNLDDFWDKIAILQSDYSELFRQTDSKLSFLFTNGKINTLQYKYYFNDIITYPFVTNRVMDHNEAIFQDMIVYAEKYQFGEIHITQKNGKGQIIEWVIDKQFKL